MNRILHTSSSDMSNNFFLWIAFFLLGNIGQSQSEVKMDKNNPLICDPSQGVCEVSIGDSSKQSMSLSIENRPVKIVYFTDPICSSCWGIEPQLRRLKLEYGNSVAIEYRMGGLLPDWSYDSGGISKPSDVAHHWDEVSLYYKMPIDGDIWLEDPLHSSYPPSIAFKAAQMQDKEKAVDFLRVLREMVFLQKKNITKWEYLSQAATQAKLDVTQLEKDYNGLAKQLFQDDLDFAKKSGVRGFPTIFIRGANGEEVMVYGFKPYSEFEKGIRKVYSDVEKVPYSKSYDGLFSKFSTLTTREYVELSDKSWEESERELEALKEKKILSKFETKNGVIWKIEG